MSEDQYQLAEGDIVQLKSGGPQMTISGIAPYGMAAVKETAKCTWFEGKTLKEALFELHSLVKVQN